MRPKTQKLVITFHTTAAAMAMEKLCHEQETAGAADPGSAGADGGLRYGLVRAYRRRPAAAGAGGCTGFGV